jgi:signal transduction histidine kinase
VACSGWRFRNGTNTVGQTADGHIWIGTASGLVKYDGVRFAAWAPPPRKSLANPDIISLLGSSDGALWIGTASGLLSWKNNELWEHIRYRINRIIQDRAGRIWAARTRAGDDGGLCQLAGEFNAQLDGRVDERLRVARELHDTILQNFHASLMHMQAARNLLARGGPNAAENLDDAIRVAEGAVSEGRSAIQGMRTTWRGRWKRSVTSWRSTDRCSSG